MGGVPWFLFALIIKRIREPQCCKLMRVFIHLIKSILPSWNIHQFHISIIITKHTQKNWKAAKILPYSGLNYISAKCFLFLLHNWCKSFVMLIYMLRISSLFKLPSCVNMQLAVSQKNQYRYQFYQVLTVLNFLKFPWYANKLVSKTFVCSLGFSELM